VIDLDCITAVYELEADKVPTLHAVLPHWHALVAHCGACATDCADISELKEKTLLELESRSYVLCMKHSIATMLYPRMKQLRMLSAVEKAAVRRALHDEMAAVPHKVRSGRNWCTWRAAGRCEEQSL